VPRSVPSPASPPAASSLSPVAIQPAGVSVVEPQLIERADASQQPEFLKSGPAIGFFRAASHRWPRAPLDRVNPTLGISAAHAWLVVKRSHLKRRHPTYHLTPRYPRMQALIATRSGPFPGTTASAAALLIDANLDRGPRGACAA